MVNMFIWYNNYNVHKRKKKKKGYNNYKIDKPFPPPWLYSFDISNSTKITEGASTAWLRNQVQVWRGHDS